MVTPKSNRLKPWIYDKMIDKRCNEIERPFRRLKAFCRIFSRFEKLDLMLTAFIHIALIMEMINSVNTPEEKRSSFFLSSQSLFSDPFERVLFNLWIRSINNFYTALGERG